MKKALQAQRITPRGFRVLGHIPRLPRALVADVAGAFPSLDAIVRATLRDLEAVGGVGASRAKEIRDGLRRLQDQNLHERYLTA